MSELNLTDFLEIVSNGVTNELIEIYRSGADAEEGGPEWEAAAAKFSEVLRGLPTELMASVLIEMTGIVVGLEHELEEFTQRSVGDSSDMG